MNQIQINPQHQSNLTGPSRNSQVSQATGLHAGASEGLHTDGEEFRKRITKFYS